MSPMPRFPRTPPARSTWACLLGCLLVLGACSSDDGGTAATSTPTTLGAESLVAQVASFDLAVGAPSRIIVGLQSNDAQLVVFGTVELRFAYFGTREAPVPSPVPGPPVTATYLPIPGTPAPPDGTGPQLVSGSQARGVYGASTAFDRPGFWQVEVTASVDGTAQSATAAFAVLDRHLVPAPGDPAPGR